MADFLGLTAGYAVGMSLLVSGVIHSLASQRFSGVVQTQTHFEPQIAAVLAWGVIVVETGVGGFVVSSVTIGIPAFLNGSLASATFVLFAFGVWSLYLTAKRPKSPCGCGASFDKPVTYFVPIRAFILSFLAGSILYLQVLDVSMVSIPQWLMGTAAGTAIALILLEFPDWIDDWSNDIEGAGWHVV